MQNFRKRLRKQIPQRDVALVIETARHCRAVGEHAELVAQTVAELCAALLRAKVGPIEFFRALKVQIVPQAEAAAARLGPLALTFFVKKGFDRAIARLRAALIPQPQRDDDALRGGAGSKAPDLLQILPLALLCAVVPFKAVERDADLVERGGCEQRLRLPREEGAVRRDADLPLPRRSEGEQFRKLRVAQRLAHHMQIHIFYLPREALEHEVELGGRHRARRSLCAGTERAAQVAAVRDLNVRFFQHLCPLLPVFFSV